MVQSGHTVPEPHSVVKRVKFDWLLDSDARPMPVLVSSKAGVGPPGGLKMAIQYTVPAVTVTPGTDAEFHAPGVGETSVPEVRRKPGLAPTLL
jgi:hypothetical protein